MSGPASPVSRAKLPTNSRVSASKRAISAVASPISTLRSASGASGGSSGMPVKARKLVFPSRPRVSVNTGGAQPLRVLARHVDRVDLAEFQARHRKETRGGGGAYCHPRRAVSSGSRFSGLFGLLYCACAPCFHASLSRYVRRALYGTVSRLSRYRSTAHGGIAWGRTSIPEADTGR
jgi:hypothetical protein